MTPGPSPVEMATVVASTGCEHIQDVISLMGGDLVNNLDAEALEFAHWFVSTSPPDTMAAPQSSDK